MKVKIKRIDASLPLPIYETDGSVGFDLLARETLIVRPKQIVLIPCNVIVEVPDGYMLLIASRSSTPIKKGLTPPHGVGVLDQDYCGENDEVLVEVYNFTDLAVTVEKGDKIAQGVFVRVDKAEWIEVGEMDHPNRGGVGSTNK
ncbi:MAG: dUTP diphosphatase [Patescibacteria group bacterium]|nr:dUTP diphosphatase [Patescibacteria group bacterium]